MPNVPRTRKRFNTFGFFFETLFHTSSQMIMTAETLRYTLPYMMR